MTNINLLQSKEIPILYISNLSGNTLNTIPASYASWIYKRTDGTYNHISVQNYNLQPNIMPNLPKIEMSNLNKKIKLSFSRTPTSYMVHCWPEALQGFKKTYYNDSKQYLEIIDNTITLPIEEPGYIIQINGSWEQGEVKYLFSISELYEEF